MFTKQHYQAIANIIKGLTSNANVAWGGHGSIDKDYLVKALADYFEKDNPNFDRELFFKACYGNIFKEAYEIITTKECGKMTKRERKVVALATSFVATQLSKVEPECDNEPITIGLLKLAKMIEEVS